MTIFSEPFPIETAGLPAAHPSEWLELADGDALDLRIGPVAKHLGDTTVRMLAYNGSVPGPVLRVQQHSTLVVKVFNDASCHNAAASSRVAISRTLPVRRLRCATAVRAA